MRKFACCMYDSSETNLVRSYDNANGEEQEKLCQHDLDE